MKLVYLYRYICVLALYSNFALAGTYLESIPQNALANINGVIAICAGPDPSKCETSVSHYYGQLNEHSQFVIGSVTKQMLAVLILKEYEKGTLNLDSPIGRYLPELMNQPKSKATLHQLLNHTAGLSDKTLDLQFEPGTSYKYSNFAYELLGRIITSQTKLPLADHFSLLFSEAKMKNSGFLAEPVPIEKKKFPALSPGYMELPLVPFSLCIPKQDPFRCPCPFPYIYPPSGGVVSTVHDLHFWNQALYRDKLLLSQNSLNLMTSKQVKIPIHRYGPSVHYGYGLMISNQDELLEYSHTGYVWGYTASNLYYPTEDISVIVLENVSRGLLGMARDQKEAGFWSHDQIRKYIRSRILREVADN